MPESKKRSPSYEKALKMLPDELHEELERFTDQYKFAAEKHTGRAMVHPVVLAELLLMGWRETDK